MAIQIVTKYRSASRDWNHIDAVIGLLTNLVQKGRCRFKPESRSKFVLPCLSGSSGWVKATVANGWDKTLVG